ncbi:MAG: ACP phosphodiesterase [Candidatus Thiodiazotropha sp.]
MNKENTVVALAGREQFSAEIVRLADGQHFSIMEMGINTNTAQSHSPGEILYNPHMNWLAHIFLSENHIEYQHGNLLADLLKGRSWDGASNQFNAGLSMHLSIDSFTDRHPMVMKSKSRLGQNGYLRGVVIDITYDHLLVQNWHRYSHTPLDAFIDTFNRQSHQASRSYPDKARTFLSKLVGSGHLMDYGSFKGVERAFWRIDSRLSPRILARESSHGYLPRVKDEITGIEQDFLRFMPHLIRYFKSVSNLSLETHWLR